MIMKLKGWLSLTAAAVCGLITFPGRAFPAPARADQMSVGLQTRWDASIWYSMGEAGFQYADGLSVSELTYPLDGYLAEFQGEAKFLFYLGPVPATAGLRGRLARSIDVKGTSTDSDRALGWLWGYSEHDCTADILLWEVDGLFAVYPLHQLDHPFLKSIETGLILGYGQQRFEFSDRDGTGYYYGEEPVTFRGLVSTYDVDFTGLRIGPYLRLHPTHRLAVSLEALMIPDLRAESDANWILRNYRFWQEAEGMGTTVSVKVTYEVIDHLQVFASLRRVFLNADKRGLESGVFLDEEESYKDQPVVPWIRAKYYGAALGLTLAF